MTRSQTWLAGLTLLAPATVVLKYGVHAPPLAIFLVGGAAVALLAEWMRRATEQISLTAGPAIGGLLNISFGSAAEFILMAFVVSAGHADVVRAQITGSIMGTSLLGLGLACLVGGWSRERQSFSKNRAGLLSSLLLIVVLALMLPAVFDHADIGRGVTDLRRLADERALSIGVSVVLLLLYVGNLVFTLITHRDVFSGAKSEKAPRWSMALALAVLVGATALVALCADLVSGALEASAAALHLPLLFVGIAPLAVVGTAADLFAAVSFAHKNRMDLAISISIGSAIQVGMVLAPLLVLVSLVLGKPMTLVFPSLLDLFAITGAAFIVNAIAADGETTWFEGLVLLGVYVVLAMAFFFISPR